MTLGMYTGNRNKTDTGLMFFMRLDRERGKKTSVVLKPLRFRVCATLTDPGSSPVAD